MRFLSLLKRYWFYSLAWLAGLWLLWVMTPVRPNVASTIYEGQEFIGFVDGGRAFVTLNLTRTDSNPLGVRERRISHGPVSIRNTETGIVERSFFSTDDRFVNLLVEPNRDHLLRCLRKQGKTSAGDFKYVLEWIDVRTGKTFASFNPVTHAEAPKGLSPLFPAALSYDGQCAFYYSLFDNKEQIVCDECDNGKRAFAPDQRVNIPYSAFSPDSRYVQFDRYEPNEGIVVVEMPSRRQVLDVPKSAEINWRLSGSWSPDSKLLYISDGTIWNLETRQVQARVPIKHHARRFFTDDSKQVVSTISDDAGVWLVYFDVETGREVQDKRLLIFKGVIGSNGAIASTRGRGILVSGSELEWDRQSVSGWLNAWINDLQDYFSNRIVKWNFFIGYALVDSRQNKIIMSGRDSCPDFTRLSPDGRFLFVHPASSSEPVSWQCWNVPPRKATAAFLFGAGFWLIGCTLLRAAFHWLSLRRRVGNHMLTPA